MLHLKSATHGHSRIWNLVFCFMVTVCIFATMCVPVLRAETGSSYSDQQELVDKCATTFRSLMADPNMGWLRTHIQSAKGIFICPKYMKGAFIFGADGGSGVLLGRGHRPGRGRGRGRRERRGRGRLRGPGVAGRGQELVGERRTQHDGVGTHVDFEGIFPILRFGMASVVLGEQLALTQRRITRVDDHIVLKIDHQHISHQSGIYQIHVCRLFQHYHPWIES